jgi:hypothetical protein
MIFTLKNLIPDAGCGAALPDARWVRSMHEPFRGGFLDRLRDARAVLRGRDVFAVRWPKDGEFEDALKLDHSPNAKLS